MKFVLTVPFSGWWFQKQFWKSEEADRPIGYRPYVQMWSGEQVEYVLSSEKKKSVIIGTSTKK